MQIMGKMKEIKENIHGFSFKCLENRRGVIKAFKLWVTGQLLQLLLSLHPLQRTKWVETTSS